MSDKVKFSTYEGEILPGRLLQIISDVVETSPNRNDPSRTFSNRVITGSIAAQLADGTIIVRPKNMAFVYPRFSTVEGLDVIDGQPLHPEKLTDMALLAQNERVGASSQTTLVLEDETASA